MPDPVKTSILLERDVTRAPRVIRILHPGSYAPENTLLHLHTAASTST